MSKESSGMFLVIILSLDITYQELYRESEQGWHKESNKSSEFLRKLLKMFKVFAFDVFLVLQISSCFRATRF